MGGQICIYDKQTGDRFLVPSHEASEYLDHPAQRFVSEGTTQTERWMKAAERERTIQRAMTLPLNEMLRYTFTDKYRNKSTVAGLAALDVVLSLGPDRQVIDATINIAGQDIRLLAGRHFSMDNGSLTRAGIELIGDLIEDCKRAADAAKQKEVKGMNYSTAVFLINPEAVRAMRCAYEVGSKEKPAQGYIFKTFDKTLKVDDYVVVPTDTRHGMTVVKIAEVDVDFDIDTEVSMKWIIGPVDTSAYAHTLEMEEIAIAKIKSAEMRKKREDLAEKLFADKREDLATLEIANFSRSSGEASATDKSEAATADQAPTPNNAV